MKTYFMGGTNSSRSYEAPSLSLQTVSAEAGFAGSGNIGELSPQPMSMGRMYVEESEY